ncbi:MFS transporter, partial [Streptomyces sp. NPDC055144]
MPGLALVGVGTEFVPSLSHGAAHTLAGGGARALDGVVPEHELRVAFASGLNTASLVAGCAALVAGVLVLALVRAPRAAHRPRGATAAGDGRGPS